LPRLAPSTPGPARRLGLVPALLAATACWIVLAVTHASGVFAGLDLRLVDALQAARGERAPSERVVLVAVDDATIGAFEHTWPLRRDYYALLVRALHEAGAAVVGIDVLFLGRSADPLYDRLLADVTAAAPGTVHASMFPQDTGDSGAIAPPSAAEMTWLQRFALSGDAPRAQSSTLVSLPYADLLASTPHLGHVAVALDRDGIVRRVPLVVRYGERLYPSLALALASAARGHHGAPRLEGTADGFALVWPDGDRLAAPMDAEGTTAIEFAGDAGAFHTYSMLEVLGWHKQVHQAPDSTAARTARAQLARAFSGRIVIVGATAVREVATDLGATPFSRSSPLVYVHANVTDALLRGAFVRQPPPATVFALLLVLALAAGAAFARVSLPAAGAIVAGMVIALAALGFVLLRAAGLGMPLSAALATAPLVYAVIASYRYVFLERRAQQNERDLDAARTIQKRLLPESPPEIAGLDIFGVNVPAREVGGDYYDFLVLDPDRVLVAVGDVAGKGVPAALLMSHLQASLHAESRDGRAPHAITEAMDESLYRSTSSSRYATFFLAIIERHAGAVRYCNAGHNAGYLVRDGAVVELEPGGAALGLLPGTRFEDGREDFGSGDVLVLYSDGVTEAEGRRNELYGDDRLKALVRDLAARAETAAAIGHGILDDIRRFSAGRAPSDDITVVVVRAR